MCTACSARSRAGSYGAIRRPSATRPDRCRRGRRRHGQEVARDGEPEPFEQPGRGRVAPRRRRPGPATPRPARPRRGVRPPGPAARPAAPDRDPHRAGRGEPRRSVRAGRRRPAAAAQPDGDQPPIRVSDHQGVRRRVLDLVVHHVVDLGGDVRTLPATGLGDDIDQIGDRRGIVGSGRRACGNPSSTTVWKRRNRIAAGTTPDHGRTGTVATMWRYGAGSVQTVARAAASPLPSQVCRQWMYWSWVRAWPACTPPACSRDGN